MHDLLKSIEIELFFVIRILLSKEMLKIRSAAMGVAE